MHNRGHILTILKSHEWRDGLLKLARRWAHFVQRDSQASRHVNCRPRSETPAQYQRFLNQNFPADDWLPDQRTHQRNRPLKYLTSEAPETDQESVAKTQQRRRTHLITPIHCCRLISPRKSIGFIMGWALYVCLRPRVRPYCQKLFQ